MAGTVRDAVQSPAQGSRGGGIPGAYGRASLAGAWWCGLGALSLGLSLLAPNGVLRDPLLPPWAGLALACTELSILAAFVLLAAGLSGALRRIPLPPDSPRLLALARASRCLAAGILLFVYAASWGVFWCTGNFLDREAFVFLAGDLGAVIGYVRGMHVLPLLAVAAAAVAVSISTCEVLPRWILGRPADRLRRFAHGAAALAAACLVLFLGGELLHARATRPADGPGASLEELYRFRRDHGAGPATRLVTELFSRAEGPRGRPQPANLPAATSRPIVSMADYRAAADGPSRRPLNVVVVVIDSLRADSLRACGGPRDVMPALDRLASASRLYTDCRTTSSHTDYATPSVLSSQYPLRDPQGHRYPEHPPYPRVFLYDVLKAFGYRTAIFSSQDERWRGMIRYLDTGSLDRFFHGADPGHPRYPEGTFDDAVTVGEALKWIASSGDAPFFAYLNLQNAHAPFRVPEDFPRRFGPRDRDFAISFGWFPADRERAVRDVYADSLSYVDAQLDRIFRHLGERGLWDRTVVVVAGDHGEAFYEHGFAAHGGPLYEEVARVPLVLRAPGLEPGRDGRPAQVLDVPPSVLHALGLPPHPAFQGVDLLAPAPREDRPLFLVAQTPFSCQYSVVRSGHKLIYDARLRRPFLYDLARDPGEKRDLSADRPDLRRELQDVLAAWFAEQVAYYADPARQSAGYPPSFGGP